MRLRPITSQNEILDIIRASKWCHMAMVDVDGNPYVLPMNFGFRDGVIYLHGAQEGKKIVALRKNPSVCINFSTDHQLRFQSEEVACSYSMKYRSVLAYGKVEFMEPDEEKMVALDIIMAQYSDRSFRYNPPSLKEVCCWKVKVERFEGRAFGL